MISSLFPEQFSRLPFPQFSRRAIPLPIQRSRKRNEALDYLRTAPGRRKRDSVGKKWSSGRLTTCEHQTADHLGNKLMIIGSPILPLFVALLTVHTYTHLHTLIIMANPPTCFSLPFLIYLYFCAVFISAIVLCYLLYPISGWWWCS